ncbi:MAG: glycine cleavage system protein GcvH [Spirochaetota bacterium]
MTKYTEEHEWIRLEESGFAAVGITEHAQEQLGELVYVELPEVGSQFAKGECTGVVESTKTASDINAPLDCEIVEINSPLEDEPELVNRDAEGQGWLYKIKIQNSSQFEELLDEDPV